MNSLFYIVIYFVVINIFGFALMGIDKRRARKSAFRIPEATLFSVAIIGGALGSTIGMFFFKHKTKHWYFKFGLPLIFLIQIVIIIVLFFLPLEIRFI